MARNSHIGTPRGALSAARRRLRPHLLPIFQTAFAAVAAWLIASALLPTQRPTFASIAAVISLGVTYGQRRRRAIELLGGVVLGVAIATALLALIGSGPLQLGVLVVLAMSAALVFRGGELLVSEAAVSAILLATLEPVSSGYSADRVIEAVIGGGVGLAVASLLLPPDPEALAGQAAQSVFGALGRTLEETAAGLRSGDASRAGGAEVAARELEEQIEALEQALSVAAETARFAPVRRTRLAAVHRYQDTLPQLDFAARDTRALARYAARQVRSGERAPLLADTVRELADAVWVLAAQYERPERASDARDLALRAARAAEGVHDREPSLLTSQIVAQVRSVAVDLMRASESLGGVERDEQPAWNRPTEELLAAGAA
jgi:uncharacterized membrane protein YgaE (UPF0421/DUF939 family)